MGNFERLLLLVVGNGLIEVVKKWHATFGRKVAGWQVCVLPAQHVLERGYARVLATCRQERRQLAMLVRKLHLFVRV